MSLRDLLLLYCVVGVACAIAVLRRAPATTARSLASAAATVPLWPLWAPFALASSQPRPRPPRSGDAAPLDGGALARIERALAEAVDAVAGTPMSEVFTRAVAARIAAEVGRVAVRLDELRALERRTGLDADASARRLRDLEAQGAPERAVATARLQHESLSRLGQLRAADAQALEELADLLEALRTQLLLARYAGSSAEGADAIVGEVWARLEGLGAAFDPGPERCT
ncbi:MAG TPA: hypothetical protein VIF15_15055 [Polyangiaceae bacterium]|jgi:hypothetical protein